MRWLALIIGVTLSAPGLGGYRETPGTASSYPHSNALEAVSSRHSSCRYELNIYPLGTIIADPDKGSAMTCVIGQDDRAHWLEIKLPGCLSHDDAEC